MSVIVMKRDMNLIREILFQLESTTAGKARHLQAPEGYSQDELVYHTTLLLEAGLIEGRCVAAFSGSTFRDLRLRWESHDFLDAVRPPAVWERVEERLKHVGGAALTLVKALAIEEGKKLLGI